MSKTISKPKRPAANQPPPEAVEAYVKGETPRSTEPRKAGKTVTQKEGSFAGPLKKFTVEVPLEAHRRFKIACAMADSSMTDELRAFVERRAAELEKKAAAG